MVQLVILEHEQLHQLARIIRNQEVEAIKNIKFNSEPELAQYLKISKSNLDSVTELLNDTKQTKEKFQTDEILSPIAHDIYSYVHNSVNFGVQSIRNYTLRANYLTKIKQHASDIIKVLEEPTLRNNVSNVRSLAEAASQYRNYVLEYTRMHQSTASRNFSKWLKETGMKFEDLVKRYQGKRGFAGQFKNLENEEKWLVYNDIIEASGRGNIKINKISKVTGAAGIVVLIFISAMMVWDIFSSEHVIETATRDAIEAVASLGGALIGEFVGAALPSLVGIQASASFLLVAAIVGGIAGAFLIGSFVGWLLDFIFDSGDSVPIPFSTDGHRCYVAPLPDGQTLARQIAHNHQLTN